MSIIMSYIKKFIIFGALAIVLVIVTTQVSKVCRPSASIVPSGLAGFCDVEASVVEYSVAPEPSEEKKSIHDSMRFKSQADVLQSKFNQELALFKRTKDYGEGSLQKVIDLLGYELKLVRLLFYGNTGAAIEYVLDSRKTRLEYSTPSVALMYNNILDLVTYDAQSNQMLLESIENNKRLSSALNRNAKKAFLFSMESKLIRYQNILRELQYQIAGVDSDDRDTIH